MGMILDGLTASPVGPQIIDESRQVRKSNHWSERRSWIKTTTYLDDMLITSAQYRCMLQGFTHVLIGASSKFTRPNQQNGNKSELQAMEKDLHLVNVYAVLHGVIHIV